MNRNLWTALMLSVALVGQAAASVLPFSTCAMADPASAHPADVVMSDASSHHGHMTAPDQTHEKECCATAADAGCGMSGCLLSAIPSSSPSLDSADPQPARLATPVLAAPPNPTFPPFRPPIA